MLTKILGQLHDDEGRIQIAGFYDGVNELPDKIFKQWDALGRTAKDFLSDVGLSVSTGETGRSVLCLLYTSDAADE